MNNDLLGAFLEQELNGSVREILSVAVKESMKPGARLAIRDFEFNCFDVVLDFESGTVTLADILSSGAGTEQTVSLPFFIEVCGLS